MVKSMPASAERVPLARFHLVAPEELTEVVCVLRPSGGLVEKSTVLCVSNPALPGEEAVHQTGRWRYSASLNGSYTYPSATEPGSTVVLPRAKLTNPSAALDIEVYPWGSAGGPGRLDDLWVVARTVAGRTTVIRLEAAAR